MNQLILSGRPTREPEIIYSGSGERQCVIAKFTQAANRIYKREGEATADFIPCVAFGHTAKLIEKYVRKGTYILVRGRLANNDYINKEGVKVYSFQMIVEGVELLEKKNGNANAEGISDENGYMQITEEEMADMPFQ